MIKSMTGYGAGRYEENGKSFSVEIKSVNHKYNDLSIKLPRTMLAFEDPIRKRVAEKISRGKVDVFINYESLSPDDSSVIFNEALGDNLVAELEKMKQRYAFEDAVTLSMLYRFPNVITSAKQDNQAFTVGGELWGYLEKALNAAMLSFVEMRRREGESLKTDIFGKLDEIEAVVLGIEKKAPEVVVEHKERMNARIQDLLGETPIDEQRLMHEVAIFADKSAIDEELTRLKSHIRQFRRFLNDGSPIGKKLDFLVQEMIRESNTIGSKSNNIDITNAVIELKALIEKIREQVQNIE